MVPSAGLRNASSASDGTSGSPDDSQDGGPPLCGSPNPGVWPQHGAASDTKTRTGAAGETPESLPKSRARAGSGSSPRALPTRTGQEAGGDLPEGFAIQFCLSVHCDHGLGIDSSLQLLHCGPRLREALRQIQAVDQYRAVLGEEMAIVAQHTQFVLCDLGIGGIDVHDIDLPCSQRLVGETVVQSLGGLRQAVSARRTRPAIGGSEIVRKPKRSLDAPRWSPTRARRDGSARVEQRERVSVIEHNGNRTPGERAEAANERVQGRGLD